MTCESRTCAVEEAGACGPEPSSDGTPSSHSTTTSGAALLWPPMVGQGSQPSVATSMDSPGILSESQAWIASQQGFLAAILAPPESERDLTGNQPDPPGEDASKQLTLFDQIGCSLKTAHESSRTDQPSGEPCESGDTIPEMAHLMPPMSERRTSDGVGSCSACGPTLTVCGHYNRKGCSKKSGNGLATWCKHLLPTLCATDSKSPYSAEGYQRQAAKRSKPLRDTAAHTIGIRLTPDFCEWWMGWPIGASASPASEMRGCRSRPQQRGVCSEGQG